VNINTIVIKLAQYSNSKYSKIEIRTQLM